MFLRMFSLQSDVWSYGVVLWELFSLARSPYPGLEPNEEFVRKLELGHRMEKPEHATEEMWVADLEAVCMYVLTLLFSYQVMRDCWCADPGLRPTFSELAEKISDVLTEVRSRLLTSLVTQRAPRAGGGGPLPAAHPHRPPPARHHPGVFQNFAQKLPHPVRGGGAEPALASQGGGQADAADDGLQPRLRLGHAAPTATRYKPTRAAAEVINGGWQTTVLLSWCYIYSSILICHFPSIRLRHLTYLDQIEIFQC